MYGIFTYMYHKSKPNVSILYMEHMGTASVINSFYGEGSYHTNHLEIGSVGHDIVIPSSHACFCVLSGIPAMKPTTFQRFRNSSSYGFVFLRWLKPSLKMLKGGLPAAKGLEIGWNECQCPILTHLKLLGAEGDSAS